MRNRKCDRDVRGISRREFFGQAVAASFVASGCLPKPSADGPRLRVGVLADVHLLLQKDPMKSDFFFEKALRWYDEMKADGVLLCGDIADCGLVAELEYAAEIWNRVFPGGKRSDGQPIVQLFHLGDHDLGGFAHESVLFLLIQAIRHHLPELLLPPGIHVIAAGSVFAVMAPADFRLAVLDQRGIGTKHVFHPADAGVGYLNGAVRRLFFFTDEESLHFRRNAVLLFQFPFRDLGGGNP